MYNALIIDDEPDARGVLIELLKMFCPQVDTLVEASDPTEALQLARQQRFDLAFIDIQLREESGLDLAQKLIQFCRNLIFVTAHEDYALAAYQTQAIHYLLKPVNPTLLQQAVQRAQLTEPIEEQRPRLLLPTRQGLTVLEQDEIIRIEGEGNYCTFYTQDGYKYVTSRHLAHYSKMLDDRLFFRIHQSHLVNLTAVREYLTEDGYFAILKNQDRLPIARRRKDDFLKALQR